jgi:pyruvate ferredoxin oxidoreductase delta subunit
MQTVHAFVRPAALTGGVTPDEFDRLVAALASVSTEIEFREGEASRHGRPLQGFHGISAALARRNVRSLLARNNNPAHIRTALSLALTGAPEDAEDGLEEAGVELNLRFALFATEAARLSIDGGTLTIEDDRPATCTLRKEDYNRAGRQVFCVEALFRLLYSRIDCVRYSPTSVESVATQTARVAALDYEAPELADRKRDWRATRRPHFVKEFCVSCGGCFILCLNDAIERAQYDKDQPGAIDKLGINYDRCKACGLCAANCPGDEHGRKAVVMVRACEEGSRETHCFA